MLPEVPPHRCRLLIFEGIMGSGKSTATRRFGESLSSRGSQVAAYTEAAEPHPVRASDDLPDFFQPWLHIGAAELASRVRQKWARYVGGRLKDGALTVMDGQLFHGDLTNLFMMEMAPGDIAAHTRALMNVLAPLRPLVVYLRQDDLRSALDSVFQARGKEWEAYQLGWKLRSPHAVRRKLAGLDGFAAMYADYRALTDSLFAELDCPKLAIETGNADWQACYRQIERALEHEWASSTPR